MPVCTPSLSGPPRGLSPSVGRILTQGLDAKCPTKEPRPVSRHQVTADWVDRVDRIEACITGSTSRIRLAEIAHSRQQIRFRCAFFMSEDALGFG